MHMSVDFEQHPADTPLMQRISEAGMMQGRGAVLSYWDGMLPEMTEEMMNEFLEIVAGSLAAGGGTAFPERERA